MPDLPDIESYLFALRSHAAGHERREVRLKSSFYEVEAMMREWSRA